MDNIRIRRCHDCGGVLDESDGLEICSDCVEDSEMALREMADAFSEMCAEGEERSRIYDRVVRGEILIIFPTFTDN